jgi:hypothetical protein
VSGRCIVGGLILAIVVSFPEVQAQHPRPLSPLPDEGNRVAPFFDGWYANPDGSITLSFGYSNLNKSTVEIPLGPDNFIAPKEHDGRQPTSFPIVVAERRGRGANTGVTATADAAAAGGRGGGGAAGGGGGAAGGGGGAAGGGGGGNYPRERGVFTVKVPADHKGDVVWTLKYRGQTLAVPGRAKSSAYLLSWPMAMGSVPPLLRFQPSGASGRGPEGIQGPRLEAKVATPIELTVWLTDDAVHEKEPIPVKRDVVPSMNATWFKHSGPPAAVVFSPPKQPMTDAQGKATTTATFNEPGEYVIRVRGDSFGNIDSSPEDQCCWTNGYWKVVVTR